MPRLDLFKLIGQELPKIRVASEKITLFQLLKSKELPEGLHIIADEAYTLLSAECNCQILTPYSQHQLNLAKKNRTGKMFKTGKVGYEKNLLLMVKN